MQNAPAHGGNRVPMSWDVAVEGVIVLPGCQSAGGVRGGAGIMYALRNGRGLCVPAGCVPAVSRLIEMVSQ
jgi:hypothetical protein